MEHKVTSEGPVTPWPMDVTFVTVMDGKILGAADVVFYHWRKFYVSENTRRRAPHSTNFTDAPEFCPWHSWNPAKNPSCSVRLQPLSLSPFLLPVKVWDVK